jgi:hypothetical protein
MNRGDGLDFRSAFPTYYMGDEGQEGKTNLLDHQKGGQPRMHWSVRSEWSYVCKQRKFSMSLVPI